MKTSVFVIDDFLLDLYHTASLILLSISISVTFLFDSISSQIGQNISFNPSLNAFAISSVEWLTYSGIIHRPDGLCCNFSVAHNLTLVANVPNCITHSHANNPVLSELFLALKVEFPLLDNSDQCCFSFD